jgi:glyoxylase-like metal-dependent hydrolase (beta-lactamase superfamily II)
MKTRNSLLRSIRRLGSALALAGLLLACVTPLGARAELQRITEHVYAYAGTTNPAPGANSYGANVGLVVGSDSVLVIDTLISAREAQRFLADIRKVTDKPIRYVINTHYHLDHSFGNGEFAKLGATIIGQDHSRQDFAKTEQVLAHPEQFGLTAADLEGTTLHHPDITFNDSLTLDLGGITVQLRYPAGPTHTDDSIVAYIKEEKVLFTGDMLFSHYHPYLAEGDFGNWTLALFELGKLPAEKIIPGHGPVSTKEDLADMRLYLEQFDSLARTLCLGKSAQNAPAIAQEMLKRLPDQGRTALTGMVERNLRARFLPQPEGK